MIGERKLFFRYCNECGKKFTPTGKKQKLCMKCCNKRIEESRKGRR